MTKEEKQAKKLAQREANKKAEATKLQNQKNQGTPAPTPKESTAVETPVTDPVIPPHPADMPIPPPPPATEPPKTTPAKDEKKKNQDTIAVEAEEVHSTKASAAVFTGKANDVAMVGSGAFDGSIGQLAAVLGIGINKGARLSADSQVNLLTLTWDVLKHDPDPTSERAVTLKSMFHEMHGYVLTRAYVQMYYDGRALKVKVPDQVLKFALQTFNNFGIEVGAEGIKALGNGQTEIDFGQASMDEEKRKKVQEENELAKLPKPSLNPKDWKTEDDYKTGTQAILSQTAENINMNLFKAIEATMEWRKAQEKDKKDKHKWDIVPKGDIFEDMLRLLGDIPTIVEGGIASSLRGYATVQGCPIGAHARGRAYFPQYSEEDVASIVKALIKCTMPKVMQLENYKPYNCLHLGTAEMFVDLIRNPKKEGTVSHALRMLTDSYGKELGSKADPKWETKAVNKMISIANLYRDPQDRLKDYVEKGYPAKEETTPAAGTPATGTETPAKEETPATPPTPPATGVIGSESSETPQK